MLGGKKRSEVIIHERKHAPVSVNEAGHLELDQMLKSADKIRITEQLKLEGNAGGDVVQTPCTSRVMFRQLLNISKD